MLLSLSVGSSPDLDEVQRHGITERLMRDIPHMSEEDLLVTINLRQESLEDYCFEGKGETGLARLP